MLNQILGAIIWLLPLILYFFLFKDGGVKQIIWAIIIFFTTWIGLLVRWLIGVLGKG